MLRINWKAIDAPALPGSRNKYFQDDFVAVVFDMS